MVLYQVLTGRLPWEGSTLAELAIRRENERPLAPTSYDPDVPETLSRAVLQSLEGEPAARYSSARELSRALEDGIAGREPEPPSDELPTSMLGPTTEPTRRIAPDPATPVAPQPVAPSRRRPPAPARPVARAPAQPPRRSAAGRVMRALGILILIAALAALIAFAVLTLTDAGQSTNVDDLIKQELSDQVQSLKDFIQDNTQ